MTKQNIGHQEQIYTNWIEIWKQEISNFQTTNRMIPTYGNVNRKKADWSEELFMMVHVS